MRPFSSVPWKRRKKHTACIGLYLSPEKGFITRGDNNPKNDEEPVTQENLIGTVTHYERNGKIHKVWNGRLGLMRARVLHGRLYLIRAVKFFLRKPYRMVKKTRHRGEALATRDRNNPFRDPGRTSGQIHSQRQDRGQLLDRHATAGGSSGRMTLSSDQNSKINSSL